MLKKAAVNIPALVDDLNTLMVGLSEEVKNERVHLHLKPFDGMTKDKRNLFKTREKCV